MINIPPIRSSSEIRTELLPDVSKTWKIGQVLNATAETNADAQGKALLRIGQHILETRTPIDLKTGDQLKLLVKSLGNTPLLNIQTTASTAHIASQNLKTFIAQQRDLTGLLQLAQKIIDNPVIPKTVKQQLIELVRQIPNMEQATRPATLKSIIQNSGIFLESRLAQRPAENLPQDIKSQLLRISDQLRNTLPELTTAQRIPTAEATIKDLQQALQQFTSGNLNLKQLSGLLVSLLPKSQIQLIQQALSTADKTLLPKQLLNIFTTLVNYLQNQAGSKQMLENLISLLKNLPQLQELKTSVDNALAKITAQQLTPFVRDGDNLLLLLFDLHLKDKNEMHLIQFRLEQEKSANEQKNSSWVVTLNFNFKILGPIEARLHLINDRIAARFRAEKESTANSIRQQINLLDTAFKNAGLNVINLDVSRGDIIKPRDVPESAHILDENA
ncbi:MAG: flagellar hook-length control protein FliK [Gammaproteobacteria bacterium]|nr:flagellar hook-length control protein FliK [Gammaproteobacteria bacterium]